MATSSGTGGTSAYASVVLSDGPRAYWRLGEQNGSVAYDSIGTFNGTYQSGVTLDEPGAIASDANTAVLIGATAGGVVVGNVLGFVGTQAFSIEAWVKPSGSDSTYRQIVDKATATPQNGYRLLTQTGALIFQRWNAGTVDAVQATALTVGVFSHVVATYDGTAMRLYVNGTLANSANAQQALPDFSAPLVLGASDGLAANLNGVLDEVAIYDFALPGSRVSAHHKAGTNP